MLGKDSAAKVVLLLVSLLVDLFDKKSVQNSITTNCNTEHNKGLILRTGLLA